VKPSAVEAYYKKSNIDRLGVRASKESEMVKNGCRYFVGLGVRREAPPKNLDASWEFMPGKNSCYPRTETIQSLS
jgi:hypothetical protein